MSIVIVAVCAQSARGADDSRKATVECCVQWRPYSTAANVSRQPWDTDSAHAHEHVRMFCCYCC